MALWNHLVPDLVQLGVQERETDKLPHFNVPDTTNNYHGNNEQDREKSREPIQRTPTYGRERIAEVGASFSIHF